MTERKNGKADPLLRRLDRTRATLDGYDAAKEAKSNDDLSLTDIALKKVGLRDSKIDPKAIYETASVIWNSYINPLAYVINPLARGYWRICKAVFGRYAYKDEEKKSYSPKGAAGAIVGIVVGTAASLYIIPPTLKFFGDAIAVEFFTYEGTAYFNSPKPVPDRVDTFGTSACSKLPCRSQVDTTEFRIRPNDYLHVKNALTQGSIHDPDAVAGGFPSELNACNYRATGRRIKMPFFQGFYANIYDVYCDAVTEQNRDVVLEKMEALRLSGEGFPEEGE